jgi:hypothetical protein
MTCAACSSGEQTDECDRARQASSVLNLRTADNLIAISKIDSCFHNDLRSFFSSKRVIHATVDPFPSEFPQRSLGSRPVSNKVKRIRLKTASNVVEIHFKKRCTLLERERRDALLASITTSRRPDDPVANDPSFVRLHMDLFSAPW